MSAARSLNEENGTQVQTMSPIKTTRPLTTALMALVAAIAMLCVSAGSAAAISPLQITEFDGEVINRAPDGTDVAATQAGSHPDEAWTSFSFATEIRPGDGWEYPTASLKDAVVQLPPGLVGDPGATAVECTELQLNAGAGFPSDFMPTGCPVDSQVGLMTVVFTHLDQAPREITLPLYNMEVARGDTPAQFGFNVAATGPIYLEPELRSDGNYGINIVSRNTSQGAALLSARAVLFGVPADPSNDTMRGFCMLRNSGQFGPVPSPPVRCTTNAPRKPFLTLPTSCTGPVPTTLSVDSWQFPGFVNDESTFMSHHPGDPEALVGTEGCERLQFTPSFEVEPETREPGAPSGYTVDLRIPSQGYENPDGLVQSHLRRAVVTMPEGVVMNPSAADGLQGCSDAQVGLDSRADAECPEGSKIGSVTVHTPILDQPLQGSVFLGTQLPDDRYRMFLVVEGPGMIIKLKGSVSPDPATGQLTATFASNPQLPFSHMRLVFKGGPRAPLANPTECGTHTMTSTLTPWSGNAPATPSDSFEIDCPGDAGGFDPGFTAGATNPVAGVFSPFVMRVTRDGGKELGRINLTMPRGMLASLRHVGVCSEAQLASAAGRSGRSTQGSPACSADSQVGTVTVGAGAGPNPFYTSLPGTDVSGRVFLTEAHDQTQFHLPGMPQAAYGLAIEVPAVAGPFDLGTVLVRAAIYVDPATAELTVLSDRMPRVLEGIPLNVRDVRVSIDRPNFTYNPTSCGERLIGGDIRAQDNTAALRPVRFDIGNCQKLRFKPRLGMRLKGRRQTKTGGHPAVRAVVRQSGTGEAGIHKARVVLPKSLALDPDNAQALCEFEDGTKRDLENHCPEGSIVGRARAVSPLLKEPLVGNVYFVKNVRIDPDTGNEIRTLPMIIAALRGEVAINLRGNSSTTKAGKLVNTFANVPDAPISRFNLNLKGGPNGILAVTATRQGNIDICKGRQIAKTAWKGQHSKVNRYKIRMRTPCGKATKRANANRRKANAKRRNARPGNGARNRT